MIIARGRKELEQALSEVRSSGRSIGFVPTMGALHEGHLSLVRLTQSEADFTGASIFVNPTQFAPNEDFDAYPRSEPRDLELLRRTGADFVYLPLVDEVYEGGFDSPVTAGPAAEGLESNFRPHFFGGVVNVVFRLFSHVRPDVAVFGEKDFQQLQVIQEMVDMQSLGVRIIGGPIERDEHGLALSSRNAYLTEYEMSVARKLNVILFDVATAIRNGTPVSTSTAQASLRLLDGGFRKVDYISVRWDRVLAAVWLGKTRLIDNVPL